MLSPLLPKTVWTFNFCFFSFWLGHHPEMAEVPESALGRWPRRGVGCPEPKLTLASFALVCPYVEHCEIMGRWRRLQGLNRHMTEPYSRLSLSPALWDWWCLWCWWGWWRRTLLWFWFWLWLLHLDNRIEWAVLALCFAIMWDRKLRCRLCSSAFVLFSSMIQRQIALCGAVFTILLSCNLFG